MLANGGKRFDGREGKISDKSLMYCFRVLSSMLKYAVLTQKINDNPCDKAIPPKVARHKSICFDDANLARMFVALNKEPIKYRAIVLTGIYTGCRLGELLGLKWSDINYDKATISITRSVQALHGRGMYAKAPKTENSIREFAASPNVMSILSEYKEWQEGQKAKAGEQWQEGGWIFTRKNGKPVFPTTPSHWFREFLKRHNLPPMRFHDLRHLSATLMIAQGVPMKNVSDRLGHADVRTTLNIYASSMKSVDRRAAESIDKFVDSITANP